MASNLVKAIRIEQHGGPEVLKLVEVEVPPPAANEVTIDQHAAGLNFIDIYFRTGLYPHPLPHGLGFEGAGVVFEVQVEKNLVDIDHRLYRLPNSTVRNGMPSLFQVKPGSVVSYSGTVSQPWSTITDIYIHKQMSEQELAEMIEKEQPRQDGEEQPR